VEFPERVRLYLALSVGQARTVVPGWIFTITDNDANVVTPGISFTAAATTAPETGGGLTVTLQRTGALSLAFSAGEWSGMVSVPGNGSTTGTDATVSVPVTAGNSASATVVVTVAAAEAPPAL
jgi:hypothetical protein